MSEANPTLSTKLQRLKNHLRDPLYRNGYALMLNTALTAGFGMIYWILAARTYSTADVGRSSALVAAMTLISAMTQLDLGSMLTRFLARAGTSTMRLILTAYAIAASFAAVASTVVLTIAAFVTDESNSLHVSFGFGVWFVLSCATWSIFSLQDSTLTGFRRAVWIPVENGTFGVVKIILLFVFASIFSSAGIFASYSVPVLVSLVPINFLIFRRFLRVHVQDTAEIAQPLNYKQIRHFVAGDYLNSLFGQATTTLIPVLVVAVLGKEQNAFFYIAQTMSLSLDLISWNLANSLTAEAAGYEHRTADLARAVLRRSVTLMFPLGIALFIAAPYLLLMFGAEYRDEATWLLRLLILATMPRIFLAVYASIARLEHRTHRNAMLSSVQAVLMIGGSIIFMRQFGLIGAGYAAILSQTVVALLATPWLLQAFRGTDDRSTVHPG